MENYIQILDILQILLILVLIAISIKNYKVFSSYYFLDVHRWKDEDVYYTESKELEIVGYGYTQREADDSFKFQLYEILMYRKERNEN